MIQLFFIALRNQTPKPSSINPIFGAVKEPIINSATSSAGFTFTLDTIEGKPFTATQSAMVYFLPSSTTRFGYREKISLMANNKSYFGFDTGSLNYTLVGQDAIFKDKDEKLSINITTFNFNYEFFLSSQSAGFDSSALPSKKNIEVRAIDFLKEIGRYSEEFARGSARIIYLYYNASNSRITIVERPQEANLVEVDFYRQDIGDTLLVSSTYPNSQNYVIMGFTPREARPKIIKAQIKFFEKSEEQVGVYIVKTGDVAFDDLQKGKGFIVNRLPNTKDITIKAMRLGYYDPDEYQEYLQPIYVFLGDNNFAAFVPAVDNASLEQNSTNSQR